MFKNKKLSVFLLVALVLGIFLWLSMRPKTSELKPNPVPLAIIKDLAEAYKPTVVFDKNTLFYPVRFDGLKKIALEVKKQVVAELEITDELKVASNQLNDPLDLFDEPASRMGRNLSPKNTLVYYYSLSTKTEKWSEEKTLTSFPDTLSLYVNASYDQYLKINYTIPFEGNQWRNFHRGDGAMFAIYFEERNGKYEPIKTRAYMHLQHSELSYEENRVHTSQQETKPIFYVTSGSHSTYHRAGEYEDVDGLPFLKVNEATKNDYAYCSDRVRLVFLDATDNNIEKWAFQGKVYWGGSPNDRIYGSDDFIGKIPLIRNLPLGNKSARMTNDPSAVFDGKRYKRIKVPLGKVNINCEEIKN